MREDFIQKLSPIVYKKVRAKIKLKDKTERLLDWMDSMHIRHQFCISFLHSFIRSLTFSHRFVSPRRNATFTVRISTFNAKRVVLKNRV